MKEQLEKIRQEALGALDGVKDAGELDALRVRFLGKKGELTGVLKMMGKLSAEERPVMGQVANNVRAAIEEKIETVRTELKEKALEARLEAEAIDVTIPGTPVQLGHRHPMNKALDEAEQTGDPRIEFELELEPLELNMNGLQMGRMRVVGWDEVDGGDMGV